MTTAAMTEKQRGALEAMEAARQRGCSLTEYAKAQGLVVREIYDGLAALRRKGMLPKATHERKSRFVSVRVAPTSTAMSAAARSPGASGVLCRIVQAGLVIECTVAEPRWLAALGSGSGSGLTDAAS